jgi:hypothetical protein
MMARDIARHGDVSLFRLPDSVNTGFGADMCEVDRAMRFLGKQYPSVNVAGFGGSGIPFQTRP